LEHKEGVGGTPNRNY